MKIDFFTKERAVTLISLVVTIIVLIILAGISILMLSGDNGILKNSESAKEKTDEEILKEQVVQVILSAKTNAKNDLTAEVLQATCEYQFGTGKTESKIMKDGTIIISLKEKNRKYYYKENGDIVVKEIKGDVEKLEGEGTLSSPYRINSIEDLIYFSQQVNEKNNPYTNQYVILERDLDFKSYDSYIYPEKIVDSENKIDLITSLTSGTGFTPIGNKTSNIYFEGIFDGNNKKIYNLYENRETEGVGLFGYIKNGTVKNLTLENITLRSGDIIGGITAYLVKGTISSCGIEGNSNIEVITSSEAEKNYVGLIVGHCIESLIENSYSKGNLEINEGKFGGILGRDLNYVTTTIRRCYNVMDIIMDNNDTKDAAAGIVFKGDQILLEECYHVGKIVAFYAWGISGNVVNGGQYSVIKNCYNIGDIEGNKSTGGIVYMCNVYNCYSIGKITSTYTGGAIMGMNYGRHMVHCYGRRGDFGKLPDRELTADEIKFNLSSYNATKGYGWGEYAVIGDRCNVMYDEDFKKQEFVDELNNLMEVEVTTITETEKSVEITETEQQVWKLDQNNINGGYPIFVWQ